MTRPIRPLRHLLPALGLILALACGGGSGPSSPVSPAKTIADTLTYSNPSSGTYTLVRNPAKSTASHLVLDLLGPAGTVSGVGFYLMADQTKVTWSPVDPGDPEKAKSAVFSNPLVKSKVSGDSLQAGIFQKGITAPVSATASTVLASVALDLKANVPLATAATITLSAGKALILQAPVDPVATAPITITVGALAAN